MNLSITIQGTESTIYVDKLANIKPGIESHLKSLAVFASAPSGTSEQLVRLKECLELPYDSDFPMKRYQITFTVEFH